MTKILARGQFDKNSKKSLHVENLLKYRLRRKSRQVFQNRIKLALRKCGIFKNRKNSLREKN